MFDISLAEIAIILIAGFIIIKPEDMPTVLRAIGRGLGKIKSLTQEIADLLDPDIEESSKSKHKTNKIKNEEGDIFEAYDIEDLKDVPDLDSKEK